MGTNGAGKSTLSNVIVGNPRYQVTEGAITFNGQDLLAMTPDQRAHAGIFMSFQLPVEIPGVSMANFIKAAVNARMKASGKDPMKSKDLLSLMKEKRELVEIDQKLLNRSVNEGFSEARKRNEIFQMAMLSPLSVSSTRQTADLTSMHYASSQKGSTNCARHRQAQ